MFPFYIWQKTGIKTVFLLDKIVSASNFEFKFSNLIDQYIEWPLAVPQSRNGYYFFNPVKVLSWWLRFFDKFINVKSPLEMYFKNFNFGTSSLFPHNDYSITHWSIHRVIFTMIFQVENFQIKSLRIFGLNCIKLNFGNFWHFRFPILKLFLWEKCTNQTVFKP